ncbi:hypothetical protein PLCT2_02719 [Planctomycetaceae bacterium]|nr:hypothetical protein PLCT2_02719 [Planctomycetaceae bacterium]
MAPRKRISGHPKVLVGHVRLRSNWVFDLPFEFSSVEDERWNETILSRKGLNLRFWFDRNHPFKKANEVLGYLIGSNRKKDEYGDLIEAMPWGWRHASYLDENTRGKPTLYYFYGYAIASKTHCYIGGSSFEQSDLKLALDVWRSLKPAASAKKRRSS